MMPNSQDCIWDHNYLTRGSVTPKRVDYEQQKTPPFQNGLQIGGKLEDGEIFHQFQSSSDDMFHHHFISFISHGEIFHHHFPDFLGGGFKHFLFSPYTLGEMIQFGLIFFKRVGSTTN